MTARKPKPVEAPSTVEDAVAAAARIVEEAASIQAPIVSRKASALNRIMKRRKELARERADIEAQKELLTAQYQAAMDGLNAHVDDIDAEYALYAHGVASDANVVPLRSGDAA